MANIAPTQQDGAAGRVTWSGITSADTPTEGTFFGGSATLTVSGTFGGASIQWQYGVDTGLTADMETEEKPAGAKFTSAGSTVTMRLSPGFIKPVRTGGDGTTNLKCSVVYVRT